MTLLNLVPGLYIGILSVISLYGFHKVLMVWRLYKYRHQPQTVATKLPTAASNHTLPRVTVQLPVYNEMYVVERLLKAVAQLEYPPDRLQIQVLDDSTDETQQICQRKVAELKQRHLDIDYIHRPHRQGFKAGALAYGLHWATGELVMIFDADFVPPANTLLQMVDHFLNPQWAWCKLDGYTLINNTPS
jgi:cellulose synthase/poly-beta-1,6-N-acetylglucosamine synthase-like glycosyltransferase